DHDSRDALLGLLPEDAALSRVLREALLVRDLIDPPEEASERLGRPLEREGEIVCVARVLRARFFRERSEASVHATARDVGERRRRGRALWEDARPGDEPVVDLRAVRAE